MLVDLSQKEFEIIVSVRQAVDQGYGIRIEATKEPIYYCLNCGERVSYVKRGWCPACIEENNGRDTVVL